MCSAPSMPAMPEMAPLPAPKQLPTPQQAPPPPPMAPMSAANPTPAAPLPPMVDRLDPQAPPPTLVQGQMAGQDAAIVKRRKSQRQELQQASGGTSALRIPLQTGIGPATGDTGATGLNIPK